MKPYTLHTFKHTAPDDGPKGWCAAVGFFDGVHLGHRYLLQQVKAEAAARGLLPMAVTFEEHPRLALTPTRYWPELLTTNKEKLALLRQEGLAACAVLHFDHAMSMLTSQEFMQKILGEGLGVKCL
ncbi:MAG: riboflavin biosynthesis protein RibF, partial [Bacteroidales bacterium]|nr:riboflavin biosynthesis protein RibF [Bacteroidales bacterium]